MYRYFCGVSYCGYCANSLILRHKEVLICIEMGTVIDYAIRSMLDVIILCFVVR